MRFRKLKTPYQYPLTKINFAAACTYRKPENGQAQNQVQKGQVRSILKLVALICDDSSGSATKSENRGLIESLALAQEVYR
jgi:hypothetical protein